MYIKIKKINFLLFTNYKYLNKNLKKFLWKLLNILKYKKLSLYLNFLNSEINYNNIKKISKRFTKKDKPI